MPSSRSIRTPALEIGYEESGPADGLPVILLHGYPYDIRAFDEVVPILAAAGHRIIVPYLRGYGTTRILAPEPMRAGEQAAIGQDLLELMDGLGIEKAVLAGFDWGARSACVVAALWPARVHGLLTCGGYQIQNIEKATIPADPEQEHRFWYQYYFHTERGRNGLIRNNDGISRLLWRLWSPTWRFDEATFQRTARSFDNPDFVEVVVHSYRHRTNSAAGDPRYAELAAKLTVQPKIGVPTIVVHGGADGVNPPAVSANSQRFFTGPYERVVWDGVGHNPPQEAPKLFAEAVLKLCGGR